MEQQRDALTAKYKDAKLVPKDIRRSTVKAKRNVLAPKYANKLTKAAWRRAKFLKPVKFALKAT
jgi:large subunit ribosomal protein L35e